MYVFYSPVYVDLVNIHVQKGTVWVLWVIGPGPEGTTWTGKKMKPGPDRTGLDKY